MQHNEYRHQVVTEVYKLIINSWNQNFTVTCNTAIRKQLWASSTTITVQLTVYASECCRCNMSVTRSELLQQSTQPAQELEPGQVLNPILSNTEVSMTPVKVKFPILNKESAGRCTSPSSSLEPIGGEPLMSAMCGQCTPRPTVTFPASKHHRPLAGTKLQPINDLITPWMFHSYYPLSC